MHDNLIPILDQSPNEYGCFGRVNGDQFCDGSGCGNGSGYGGYKKSIIKIFNKYCGYGNGIGLGKGDEYFNEFGYGNNNPSLPISREGYLVHRFDFRFDL